MSHCIQVQRHIGYYLSAHILFFALQNKQSHAKVEEIGKLTNAWQEAFTEDTVLMLWEYQVIIILSVETTYVILF